MNQKTLTIRSATYIDEYKIKIIFQDNVERIVNFQVFLENSTNPLIREYLDSAKFKTFRINNGQLMWGDYDLIFPINELYSGKISA